MQTKAQVIINWVDLNLPPLSWRIIAMKQMKLFLKHKISPASINSETCFNEEIIEAIRLVVKTDYSKELPKF
jgi:hypothetical protein